MSSEEDEDEDARTTIAPRLVAEDDDAFQTKTRRTSLSDVKFPRTPFPPLLRKPITQRFDNIFYYFILLRLSKEEEEEKRRRQSVQLVVVVVVRMKKESPEVFGR